MTLEGGGRASGVQWGPRLVGGLGQGTAVSRVASPAPLPTTLRSPTSGCSGSGGRGWGWDGARGGAGAWLRGAPREL